MAKQFDNKVVTNEVRLVYAHLNEPYANDSNSDKQYYSACLLIPKEDTETVDLINNAIDVALKTSSAFKGKVPSRNSVRTPLRDGDDERGDNPIYAGHWFLNAKSQFKPIIVDKNVIQISDPDEIYSGMYGNVVLTFYGYAMNGNRGIGCSLGNIQKTRDGERMGGARNSLAMEFGAAKPKDGSEALPF